MEKSKQTLTDHGYTLLGDEPLKITLHAAKFGYTGREIADILLEKSIVCEAMLSPCESMPVEQSVGRVLSAPTLACPPAVPIAIPGDRISEQTVKCMKYYGMRECCVVKK